MVKFYSHRAVIESIPGAKDDEGEHVGPILRTTYDDDDEEEEEGESDHEEASYSGIGIVRGVRARCSSAKRENFNISPLHRRRKLTNNSLYLLQLSHSQYKLENIQTPTLEHQHSNTGTLQYRTSDNAHTFRSGGQGRNDSSKCGKRFEFSSLEHEGSATW